MRLTPKDLSTPSIDSSLFFLDSEITDGNTASLESILKNISEKYDVSLTFEEAAKPLLKYLCDNHHPHTSVIVTCNSAELVEGIKIIRDDSFIKD